MQLKEPGSLSESSEQEYTVFLMAVRKNIVVGVWKIAHVERDDDGRATFELNPTTKFKVSSAKTPVSWPQGQANPVKLVETATMQQKSSNIEYTREGNVRVQLNGWSMSVYSDGRARISPPGDSRVVVEPAFPGPNGANITSHVDGTTR
ncbi:hypothetical protein [Promicromonospora sp. NPDC057488]|uniref:hypothetical protein n=1 Tax=Promicromonospora sp. NPDC057488 TaxID=3346147 RepID=UPI00366D90BB